MKNHGKIIVKNYYEQKYKIYKFIVQSVVIAGLFTMFCMALATMFTIKATKSLDYNFHLSDIRYRNIK